VSVDAVTLSADAAAGWHSAWLAALGLRSERRDGVWRALDPAPVIYWSAITLSPDVAEAAVAGGRGVICDAWSALELADAGWVVRAREPWFVRPPGELAHEDVPRGLEIVQVSTAAEVAEFELVSVRGFESEDASIEPGAIHPPTILGDPRMTMLTGRAEGRPVAAAMSYRTDAAVGVYGVTTVASARGRGYASALTRALTDPALPATLSPSPEAESLYRRLGFEHAGELRMWQRR
jgi:hypothetical protein